MKCSLAAADLYVRLLEVDVSVAGLAVGFVRRQVPSDVKEGLEEKYKSDY